MQKYEKGANRVGAGRLTRIASVLKVPVSTFFGGHAGPDDRIPAPGGQPDLEYLVQPGALRLSRAYGRIERRALQYLLVVLVERIAATPESDHRQTKNELSQG